MINFDEPGMLNRRVRILRYKETVDEYGLTHQTLEDVFGGPIWALIEPARGHTYYEQYRDKVELITKIIIRYRKGIDENMLVAYGGRQYKITSIVDPYEAHVKLELMCNLKERGAQDGT